MAKKPARKKAEEQPTLFDEPAPQPAAAPAPIPAVSSTAGFWSGPWPLVALGTVADVVGQLHAAGFGRDVTIIHTGTNGTIDADRYVQMMQGLADGYFVLPYTIGNYLAPMLNKPTPGVDHPEFKAAEQGARARYQGYLDVKGTRSPDWFHRELGKIIWDYCGMERTEQGLEKALSELPALYDEFQKDLRVTGDGQSLNQTLEKAGRVDDFFQLGMLMCRDALERKESCGGHFRAEYQDDEGEAQRDDEHFAHVAAWEWTGDPMNAIRNVEELEFETIHLAKRSYK